MSTKFDFSIHRHKGLLLLALLTAPALATADVYRCTDADGVVTITNSSQGATNCTKVATEAPQPPPSASKGAKTPTPSSFPKVDSAAQETKDKDRKHILTQELEAEQKALEEAKKELTEQESVRLGDERNYQKMLDRLQPYKDQVSLHEQNIEALKKELAR